MKKRWIYGLIFLGILGVFVGAVYFRTSRTVQPAGQGGEPVVTPATPEQPQDPVVPMFHYIEIMNACDWEFVGSCVNLRAGPGTNYRSILRLRNGIVLKVKDTTVQADGHEWYRVVFDTEVRYPERVTTNWYVAANPDFVRPFTDVGDVQLLPKEQPVTTKHIVVDLSEQMLYAYDGDTLFMQESISTGIEENITPIGTFKVYKKMPSRYMQGPLPGVSDEYYDLPGVAWDLYFTQGGAVLHAAYWHNNFGKPMSHGCVNQRSEEAKKLYGWAELGTSVTVRR